MKDSWIRQKNLESFPHASDVTTPVSHVRKLRWKRHELLKVNSPVPLRKTGKSKEPL